MACAFESGLPSSEGGTLGNPADLDLDLSLDLDFTFSLPPPAAAKAPTPWQGTHSGSAAAGEREDAASSSRPHRELTDDVDLRALQSKLELVALQRQMSSMHLQSFVAELEAHSSYSRSMGSSPTRMSMDLSPSLSPSFSLPRRHTVGRRSSPLGLLGPSIDEPLSVKTSWERLSSLRSAGVLSPQRLQEGRSLPWMARQHTLGTPKRDRSRPRHGALSPSPLGSPRLSGNRQVPSSERTTRRSCADIKPNTAALSLSPLKSTSRLHLEPQPHVSSDRPRSWSCKH